MILAYYPFLSNNRQPFRSDQRHAAIYGEHRDLPADVLELLEPGELAGAVV